MAIWGHLASACYFAVFRRPKLARPICSSNHSAFMTRSRASQVFVGRRVDAEPSANQMTDRFSLKLANGKG